MSPDIRRGRDGQQQVVIPEFLRGKRPLLVRPHHFTYPNLYFTRNALCRQVPATTLAREFIDAYEYKKRIDTTGDRMGYLADVVPRSELEKQHALVEHERAFAALSDAPDDFPVRLGLDRDGTCFAMSIGAHCVATNYLSINPPHNAVDIVKEETAELNKVRSSLQRNGYLEGIDYVNEMKEYVMRDFQEGSFRDGTLNLVRVNFNTLIVKAGALRRIAREFDRVTS